MKVTNQRLPMENCIVYFSHSTWSYQDDDLLAILDRSRRDNTECGITGVLLYVSENIVQVLEGAKQPLDALYKRIKKDGRHTEICQVINRPIEKRLFADFSMGYKKISTDQLRKLRITVDFSDHSGLTIKSRDTDVMDMVKIFYAHSVDN